MKPETIDGFYLDNESNIKPAKFLKHVGKYFVSYTNLDTGDECLPDDGVELVDTDYDPDYIKGMFTRVFYRTEGEARVEKLRASIR